VRYSVHAERRIAQYGVSAAEVEAIVTNPTRGRYIPNVKGTIEHFGYAADGRPMNVVTDDKERFVITVVPE
jgi:hypothetical protein